MLIVIYVVFRKHSSGVLLHHGSVCESIVRKMNNAMKVIAGESMLKDEGLQTMLEEGHSALLMTLKKVVTDYHVQSTFVKTTS